MLLISATSHLLGLAKSTAHTICDNDEKINESAKSFNPAYLNRNWTQLPQAISSAI
jgi:hypothetical protein